MDRDDLELFQRSVRNATESTTGAALDAALVDLGWHEALAFEPRAAVATLFELQGAANATSSALDHLLLHALGVEASSVVLPPVGAWSPPGEVDGDRLVVHGLGTAALVDGATAVVAARTADKEVAVVVATTDLTRRPVGGVDPWLRLVEVHGMIEAADVAPGDWSSAVALGHLALGHELVGASRQMLALAREHALERVQFGQPIAMFQAIRHRLAETLVAIEAADAVLDAAWLDGSPQTSAMAKALAGRAARTSARHCQQVLAGIGFTTEHELHEHIRRVVVLDQLFGGAVGLTRALGDQILASSTLPDLLPL
jgi:hypothetical protein